MQRATCWPSRPPRIEVINLDRWVSQFLKRKSFAREVAFFGEGRDRLDQVWRSVFDDHELPEGLSEPFIRAEWAQIVQGKGVADQRGYLKASRAGRGTPLDRKKRAALWDIFADYRARLISEGLAEPDDAYREATEILTSEAPNLPYAAVIVDEAQDMGEQAFRLIRAVVPETPSGDRNSLFIVGDAHQRIHQRNNWLVDSHHPLRETIILQTVSNSAQYFPPNSVQNFPVHAVIFGCFFLCLNRKESFPVSRISQ
ncbi:UvrD-helicase domain-containing protein [Rhodovarius sp.]|uniref:UvrD-helicase domain-containing protein n=1 Tax=Rhodovarius sp. TaxID=2972673 RepID=UPI00333F5985